MPEAAVEKLMTHDPAATFAGRGIVAIAVQGPSCLEPGGVVGVLGETGGPVVVGQGRVPCRAHGIQFIDDRGAGGTSAGR